MMAAEIIFKIADAPTVAGGKALVPFDGAGNRLPGVVEVSSSGAVGVRATVTITLSVDGKAVRFE